MISFKSILASFYNFDQLQADDSVDEEVLNAYCFMYASFDIPPEYEVGKVTNKLKIWIKSAETHQILHWTFINVWPELSSLAISFGGKAKNYESQSSTAGNRS